MRYAAHLAEQLLEEHSLFPEERLTGWSRNEIIEYTAGAIERWTGIPIDPAQLWERPNRPKGRRKAPP